MKIIVLWMTLDELEGSNMKCNYKGRDGESLVKYFKYWQPFGFYFWYFHQVDYHNNRLHSNITLERTWDTRFWPDRNFACYLVVTEVNIALASGHFQIMAILCLL